MNARQIRAHPYLRGLYDLQGDDDVRPIPAVSNHRRFWTRVLADITRLEAEWAGSRRDVEILGGELTDVTSERDALRKALDQARLAGPPHPPTAEAAGQTRPLTLSAQEALRVALTRPRSELDPYVLHPNECTRRVIEELEDHGLVTIHGDGVAVRQGGLFEWWHFTLAYAELTPAALTLPQEPNL